MKRSGSSPGTMPAEISSCEHGMNTSNVGVEGRDGESEGVTTSDELVTKREDAMKKDQ